MNTDYYCCFRDHASQKFVRRSLGAEFQSESPKHSWMTSSLWWRYVNPGITVLSTNGSKLLTPALSKKMATSEHMEWSAGESPTTANSSDSGTATVTSTGPSVAVKMDSAGPSEVSDAPATSSAEAQKKAKKTPAEPRLQPNYFVCQRIKNPTLLDGLSRVIEHVCSEQKLYTRFAYSSVRLHLTWCTFHAADKQEAERAAACLQTARTEICQLAPAKPIRVEGLGQFRDHLLYASIIPDPALGTFSKKIQAVLKSEGIATPGNRPHFNPHLTMIKKNPKARRILKSKTIDMDLLADFQEKYFGDQVVDILDVCAMHSTRKVDGFYEVVGSILLEGSKLLTSVLAEKMVTSEHMEGSTRESPTTAHSSDSETVMVAPTGSPIAVKMDSADPNEATETPSSPSAKAQKKAKKTPAEPRLRPNYFVCQRITNPTLLDGLSRVIEHVCAEQKLYTRFAYSSVRLHLTWCTFHAADKQEAERATACLQTARTDLCQLAPTEHIRVEGLGQFRDHLLYASILPDPALAAFSEKLQAVLNSEGIATPGNYQPFTPHLTMIKRNPKAKQKLKSKAIDADLLADFQDTYFGDQDVDVLDVCAMQSTRKKDEFYEVVGSIPLKSDP